MNMTQANFASGTDWTGANLSIMRGINNATALTVVGPRALGYDVEFHPLPGGVIGRLPGSVRTM